MDRIRQDRQHPLWLKLKRNARTAAILIAVVFGVAMLPVLILSFWIEKPGESVASIPFLDGAWDEEWPIPNDDVTLQAAIAFPDTPGPHPAVVVVHGSGRSTRFGFERVARYFAPRGIAVLAYDKRGVGDSTGDYSGVGPGNSQEILSQLASDALAGVRQLRQDPRIRSDRVGLLGFSQAGWIIPLAASQSADVAFIAILSGPTVSVGEEIYYSRLTGDDAGSPSDLSDAEISAKLRDFNSPRGFDPVPSLKAMQAPGIWIYGARDRSIQVAECIEIMDRLIEEGKDFTYKLHPQGNHGLRDVVTGERLPAFDQILEWMQQRGFAP